MAGWARWWILALLLVAAACADVTKETAGSKDNTDADADGDTDTDTDSDADSDADADADADTDSDTDADTDTDTDADTDTDTDADSDSDSGSDSESDSLACPWSCMSQTLCTLSSGVVHPEYTCAGTNVCCNTGGDADTDADTDADADADADTDTDTDADSDTDTDCNTPPPDACLTSQVLTDYEDTGTWNGAECVYEYEAVVCEFGCQDGACLSGECEGVVCDHPPPSECLGSVLQTFSSPGTCSEGFCTYSPVETSCQFGCFLGACQPCQQGVNVAPLLATPSSSGGGAGSLGPERLNDGGYEDTCNFCWVAAGSEPVDAWIQYNWSEAMTLWGIAVDTTHVSSFDCTYSEGRALAGGTVQWWDGAAWNDIGTVSGQTDDWTYPFPSHVTTTAIRIFGVHASPQSATPMNPVVYEWEVFACE